MNNWRQMDLEELIALSGDTPASHSVSPGSDGARKMTVTSGRKCIGSWLPSGPLGACLKMLLATSTWGSTKCFLTWKAKDTPHGRLLFQLAPSMPRTDETGYGLWLTPTCSESVVDVEKFKARMEKYRNGTTMPNLAMQVSTVARMWPTPDATPRGPAKNWTGTRPSGAKEALTLQTAVKMWPTPTTRDYKGANSEEHLAKARGHHDQLPNAVKMQGHKDGQLNPTWVEWLMGFPLGWTGLDASETPSSRKSQK